MEPLFMRPVFQERIWGGERLNTVFGFHLPSKKVGENWAISAHPYGTSIVENGNFKGEKLDELWHNHKELFGNPTESTFPLLVKILDAKDDLSVQVHPDDSYSLQHENELGKTECWYIIDAEPGAEIIYGHNARTRDELIYMINNNLWDKLLKRVPVKKGDFYFVPSGTIHAIGKGVMILETQQSSDTTYRLYDYDRKDTKGNLRDLHIQQSVDVTSIPSKIPDQIFKVEKYGDSSITTLVDSSFFNVYKWSVNGNLQLTKEAPYTLATVIEGNGTLITDQKSYVLNKGNSFILPDDISFWEIHGSVELIASNNQ
ncbi:mannose-6-phosphate isomerase, class I [Oceanobacillus jeddahense]|uniref:Mannose-6-phosphate isomerase n=1 Tax=Oceanobacillus jeddahense TaxID=1462527 RepID=A0ABY5JRT8_9BACI|nr:mannose-6-phosphate isomerase, class I [Oceanobacillus jeddahense]UUI02494.1 mannose-6-phosphate isomerase, class I [Oceanobacillus jeddahense]